MKKVLFVCMGNICRSPAAEAIFKKYTTQEDLGELICSDSAGTIDYHSGEQADERMRYHALRRGYKLEHTARKFDPDKDFQNFDYILTMDNENYHDLVSICRNQNDLNKIIKIKNFFSNSINDEVPDPYYGGSNGFENVLDILEDATRNLLDMLKDELKT